jgi:hypothetical protein
MLFASSIARYVENLSDKLKGNTFVKPVIPHTIHGRLPALQGNVEAIRAGDNLTKKFPVYVRQWREALIEPVRHGRAPAMQTPRRTGSASVN